MLKQILFGWVLGPVLLSGCASVPEGPSTLPPAKLATISWTDFPGMTQDDLRDRIGMPRTGQTLATQASIMNGDIHSEIWALHFLKNACTEAPKGYRASANVSHNNATLELVNGRIVRMRADKLQAGPPADADNPFVVSCNYLRRMSFGESLNSGQTVGLLPLAPIFMVSKGIGDAAAVHRYAAFAELRLGQPPPGGYDAWIREHRSDFVAASLDGDIEVRFNTPDGRDKYRPPAARLSGGRVVSLNAGKPCLLRGDNSLAC